MENKIWYSIGNYQQIQCANCQTFMHNLHSPDHHSRICPYCEIDCIWYDYGENIVLQIIPEFAPSEFKAFIYWAQENLDELEIVNLIIAFEELGKNIKNT